MIIRRHYLRILGLRILVVAVACQCLVATSAWAEWGSLKGRFVYSKGEVSPEKVNINKDVEYCAKHDVVSEEVVTGEKGALQNVFVYLYVKRGKSVEIHPDLQKVDEEKPVVLDNKGCRFVPHALIVRTKQPFEIRNSDPGIGHNTNAQTLLANPKFNEQVSNDTPITKVFEKSESYPAQLACNVRPTRLRVDPRQPLHGSFRQRRQFCHREHTGGQTRVYLLA